MCLDPGTPNIGQVGGEYSGLLSQFAGGVPQQLATEAQYKPGFVNTELAASNQSLFGNDGTTGLIGQYQGAVVPLAGTQSYANNFARASDVNSLDRLGAGAAAAVQSVNPEQAALTGQLNESASDALAAGSGLSPSDVSRVTQQVRGDWASRGLGDAAPAQLDEAMQLYGQGQANLASRQNQAASTIGLDQSTVTNPALGLATQQSGVTGQAQQFMGGANQFQQNASASLVPTSQLSDVLSTVYNAHAASQISSANNTAAVLGGALSY